MAECTHNCDSCGEKCEKRDFHVNLHKDSKVKKVIGIGYDSTSNNYIIKDILNVLCLMELLEIQADTELSDNGGYKTIFKVVKMRDSVTDKVAEALEARRVKNLDK